MTWLKTNVPVVLSPTFWGLTFTAIFSILGYYEVADEGLLMIIATWLGGVTGVNVIWKFGKKISGN